ncbi:MAG: two-component system, response regulator YesN [Clostridia bacterium]|jgi:YesN/AraC family two-component response regulator|nr:two-component system, response regulator YesN [Clostridia bacterium]MDN5322492.1 two-component system, response regulator YesN [Clostridia bacterium]
MGGENLYKLLIVDDEPTVLKFIRFVINEYKLPFYICGEGENGEQAVEMVDKYRPDFVIIDIHMPLMDGLKAAEIIKKRYPQTKVYILTAYEYFQYAQKAIKINVEDYLLKPLKAEQLSKALKDGIAITLRQKIKFNEKERLKKQLEQIKPVMRKQLVNAFITNRLVKTQELLYLKKFLNLEQNCPGAVIVVSCYKREIIRDNLFLDSIGKEIDILFGYGLYTTLSDGTIVVLCHDYSNEIYQKIQQKLPEWQTKYSIQIFGGVTPIFSTGTINTCFQEADLIRKSAYFWGEEGIFSPGYFVNLSFDFLYEKQIYNLLIERKFKKAEEIIRKMIRKAGSKRYVFTEMIFNFRKLITIILHDFSEQIISKEEANQMEKRWEERLEEIAKASDLEELLIKFVRELGNKIYSVGENQGEQLVKWAVDYINKNFHQKLTLKTVADKLFLSPSYFSRIFKKYTGEGFAGYLARVRINNAQNLLLTGKYSVGEVAKRVGFDDPSYFSSVFKKYKNVTPNKVMYSLTEQEF